MCKCTLLTFILIKFTKLSKLIQKTDISMLILIYQEVFLGNQVY